MILLKSDGNSLRAKFSATLT